MNILIIHTAFIGDIVLSTPLIHKVADTYPAANIDFLTINTGAAILTGNPYLRDIIVYEKHGKDKGLRGFIRIAKKLRQNKYDLVITPHRYLRSSLLAFLTGAKDRRGYDVAAGSFFFTEKYKYDKSIHEVERLLSFLPDNGKRYPLELFPSQMPHIDDKYQLAGKHVIVIAPGSKWFTKMWPHEYFSQIIKELSKLQDVQVIIAGSKEELAIPLVVPDNVCDMRGKTTLPELARLISMADIVVANDSSPLHIGSSFPSVKVLAIFGATTRELGFFPWTDNCEIYENNDITCRPCALHGGKSCPESHFKCMRDIKPEIIIDGIKGAIYG